MRAGEVYCTEEAWKEREGDDEGHGNHRGKGDGNKEVNLVNEENEANATARRAL